MVTCAMPSSNNHMKVEVKPKFKAGDVIRLRDYSEYGDYKLHKNQSATLRRETGFGSFEFDWYIAWQDGSESCAKEKNMLHANTEWDEETN